MRARCLASPSGNGCGGLCCHRCRLRLVLAPGCNTLVSLLKQSSLAAVIALPEIMNQGWVLAAQSFRPIEVLTLVALIYFVLTWPLVLLAAQLEKRSALAFQAE